MIPITPCFFCSFVPDSETTALAINQILGWSILKQWSISQVKEVV